MIWAAYVLGTAMVGTVLVTKPAQPPEIRIIERSPKEEVILFAESKIEKIIEKKR